MWLVARSHKPSAQLGSVSLWLKRIHAAHRHVALSGHCEQDPSLGDLCFPSKGFILQV